MVDQLKRYREPLAVVVAVVVAVNLVLDIVGEALAARTGVIAALRGASEVGLVSVLCVLLTAGLCWLVDPVTRHARAIALTGALIVTAATLVALVNLIGTLLAPAATFAAVLEAIGGGTDLALKGVAAFVLWQLARRRGAGDERAAVSGAGAPATSTEIEPAQPTWSRDAAAGASWQSARQAATGAAPGRWGSSASGWGAAASEPTNASAAAPSLPETRTPQGIQRVDEPARPGENPAPSGDPWGGPPAQADRSLWNPPS